MNIYEIDKQILECIDTESGEIIDEDKLNELQLERDTKVENVALWVKNLKADSKAIGEEKKNLDERKKVIDNKVDSLERYLSSALSGEKFSSPRVVISFRKSTKTIIDDMTKIPERFLKVEPTADKTEIKKFLMGGGKVDGCHLEDTNNIQIK